MSDPQSLDERLRKRARESLRAELNQAADKLRDKLRTGGTIKVSIDGKDHDPFKLVTTIVDAVFKVRVEREESEEIRQFMQKVDQLQEQIDDLQNGL